MNKKQMNKTLRYSEYYGMIPQLDKLYDLSRKNHVLSESKRIEKHLKLLQLTTSQIEKINVLRLKAGYSVLTI
ncbi:hypothetical protein [Enterococcus sp. UD-01]|jgi:hypothetical protein|uniref:hypothetical protein n=1 Tax=Enterococcus sp. UD-01 TaxID=3373911 RepID=UPI0038358E68